MPYTDTDLIENALGRDLSDYEKTYLIVLIPAVQAWINSYTGSYFEEVTANTTRYFDGGECSMDVDPFIPDVTTVITSVNDDLTVNYTYIVNQDYILEPQNATVKNELRHRNGSFPHGEGNIAITAKFTEYDGEVPNDIQAAATMICIDMLSGLATDDAGAPIKAESIEGHNITYATGADQVSTVGTKNAAVLALLDSHRDVLLG